MASELRVNTLKDASGNNSIGLSYVAEGSAKAWVMFVGASLTSDADLAGVSDSFNLSSVVDNGTGDHTFTVTNGFSTVNYSTVTGRQQAFSGFGAHADIKYNTSPTSTAVNMEYREHYAVGDTARGSISWLGDLA
jgi:hypothetical protein